jgi:hypothetical protein
LKEILILAHRAATILASELKTNERRKIITVAYHIERALCNLNEISSLLHDYQSNLRARQLTSYNLLHLRKQMMRVRMDIVFLFCEEIEMYASLLSSRLSSQDWIDLTVMRYNLPYQWGLMLSLKPLPDLDKLKKALHS